MPEKPRFEKRQADVMRAAGREEPTNVRPVPSHRRTAPRVLGGYEGRIVIREGFEELPHDVARAFGHRGDNDTKV